VVIAVDLVKFIEGMRDYAQKAATVFIEFTALGDSAHHELDAFL
jgi:hypothetical protein